MSYDNKSFEKLSFWKLLDNRNIEIPIIQRDYAQGRENQKKVRDKFLSALYEALIEESVELDFVYGSEENCILQPLDGQQRLTTLFLLHWYIANKEGKISEAKERLLKFTYETRTSSREFCKELIDKSINYKQLLSIDEKKITAKNQLSETIKDSNWFVDSWKKDPTISAMLIMLDAIQAKFSDVSGLWDKLTATENPPITFLYVKLENFGLSDDLYIKMNARGKQLTPFENFKTQFEKYIETNKWEEDKKFDEKFAFKIDTVWTDLFWQYKEKQKDGSYSIDTKLINFIAGIVINYYAQEYISSQKEKIEDTIQQLANNPKEVIPEYFTKKEAFEYLSRVLDIYSVKSNDNFLNAELKSNIALWDYSKKTLFEEFIQFSEPQYKPRILFYAQTGFLLKNSTIEEESFNEWMRVVRNIVENSTIDSPESFIGAITLIKELSTRCIDIYKYLSSNNINSKFASEQVKEEIEKAKIIVNNLEIKKTIFEIEDTNFCTGSISWCLNCINIDTELNNLEKIKSIIKEHLNCNNISSLFRRALLTIDDNCFYNYWNGNNQYKSWKINLYKRRLILDINELKKYFLNGFWFNKYFKNLIIQLITKDMQEIVNDYECPNNMHNWKKRLIKEDLLGEKSYYFGLELGNKKCYLYPNNSPKTRLECKLIE